VEEAMNVTLNKRIALWAALLTLIFVVGAPSVAQAQGRGRGRGQDKKAGKFKNGHDARDGRWDGRGPRGNRDDRDDDDDYRDDDRDYRYGRNRRSNDGSYDRTDIRRRAQSIGYQEGFNAGQADRASGRRYSPESYGTYRDATAGYDNGYGDLETYRSSFREAFKQGYEEGYSNRSGRSTRGRVGTILGDILGRP
jgi:hypothetical protein